MGADLLPQCNGAFEQVGLGGAAIGAGAGHPHRQHLRLGRPGSGPLLHTIPRQRGHHGHLRQGPDQTTGPRMELILSFLISRFCVSSLSCFWEGGSWSGVVNRAPSHVVSGALGRH